MTDRIPVWCKGEDWCALKSTSKILGHKWVPVIAFHINENEEVRFGELQDEIGAITNKTLSNNLKRMEDRGIVNRNVTNDRPVKIRYSLTDFGEKLIPLIEEMVEWGRGNLKEAEKDKALIS